MGATITVQGISVITLVETQMETVATNLKAREGSCTIAFVWSAEITRVNFTDRSIATKNINNKILTLDDQGRKIHLLLRFH
jgi:hypothetical protein